MSILCQRARIKNADAEFRNNNDGILKWLRLIKRKWLDKWGFGSG